MPADGNVKKTTQKRFISVAKPSLVACTVRRVRAYCAHKQDKLEHKKSKNSPRQHNAIIKGGMRVNGDGRRCVINKNRNVISALIKALPLLMMLVVFVMHSTEYNSV